MPDVRIHRPIPGTDFRPGDIIGTDDNGDVILVRILTPDELAAIRAHPTRVCVYRADVSWLGPFSSGPSPCPRLRVIP